MIFLLLPSCVHYRSQTKTPLSIFAQGRSDPRYHLGWGVTPPLCRHRPYDCLGEGASRSRGTQPANLIPMGFGGDSGGAFGAGSLSSLHSPRLAGCSAWRVLL